MQTSRPSTSESQRPETPTPSSSSSITVAVRIRPISKEEHSLAGGRRILRPVDSNVVVFDPSDDKVNSAHSNNNNNGTTSLIN